MEVLVNSVSITILLPLAAALFALLLPNKFSKWITLAIMAAVVVFSIIQINHAPIEISLFNSVVFRVDDLSVLVVLFASILGLVFSLYTFETKSRTISVLFPLTIAFINGGLSADNVIVFITFWGLSGLVLYLFGILKKPATDISKKALMISGISDALLIFAFFFFSNSSILNSRISLLNSEIDSFWKFIAALSLALAAFAKAGTFPLHTWVPDYCDKAPVEAAYLLPGSMDKLLGIYILGRLFTGIIIPTEAFSGLIASLGSLTIFASVMMALIQHRGRRLLGYHAVSQTGYMVLGIATGNPIGIAGGILHMINHSIYKSGLLMTMGNVEERCSTGELEELGGLSGKMPVTFATAVTNSFSISGLPLTNGFISKWLVYQGVLITISKSRFGYQLLYILCLILALFGSALTMASFMKYLHSVFLGKRPEKLEGIKEVSISKQLAVLTTAGLCISMGIIWRIFPGDMLFRIFQESMLNFPGLYSSTELLSILALVFIAGIFLYFVYRRIRVDEAFIGGQADSKKFRISGVSFFKEIREMQPLKKIYDTAEKKRLDIYEYLKSFALLLTYPVKKVHTGNLAHYSTWIIFGLAVLLIIFTRSG